jgi:glycosyltransferase involved in cell wall biosynthesis
MKPEVLAVVPVYNGDPSVVIKVIKSLISQDYPFLKVAVIDDCSSSSVYSSLSKEFSHNPKISFMRNEKNIGFSQTLNKALELATNESFLLVLEQDCVLLNNNYITNALKHFSCGNVAIVSGENSLPPSTDLSLMQKIFLRHLCEDVHDTSVSEIGFSLLKADVFKIDVLRKVNGFESSAKWKFACEEHIVSYKIRNAGYKIIKDSQLRYKGFWSGQERLAQNLQKEALYGRGLGWAVASMRSDLRTGESKQLKCKKINRSIQIQYVLLTLVSILLFPFFPLPSLLLLLSSAFLQFVYLAYRSSVFELFKEKVFFVVTGFLRSWVYIPNFFFGLFYGFMFRLNESLEDKIR